jgi:hypothetical protein
MRAKLLALKGTYRQQRKQLQHLQQQLHSSVASLRKAQQERDAAQQNLVAAAAELADVQVKVTRWDCLPHCFQYPSMPAYFSKHTSRHVLPACLPVCLHACRY